MLIDCHTHPTPSRTTLNAQGTTHPTPDELLAMMDAAGIDRAVILPGVSPEGMHRLVPVEDVLAMAAAHPDRFIPFCNVDPRFFMNQAASDFGPMLRYYRDAGCRGVGELTCNLAFDDPRVWNLFYHCEETGLPVLFHIGPKFGDCYGLLDDLHLPRLEQALRAFPRLIFLGHSQPFWAEMGGDVTDATRNGYPKGPVAPGGRLPALFERYPNLWGDLSAGSGFNAVSRDPVFGAAFMDRYQDRLMHGNDITAVGQSLPLANYLRESVREGRLSATAFEKIAWRNADRLLRLGLS